LTTKESFHETIDNALLHLYLSIKEEKRFTPTTKRNEILIKYLKNTAKKNSSRDIKRLLITTRKSKENLEKKLLSLKAKESEKSDLRLLFNLLNHIATKHKIEALFLTENEKEIAQENTLYMYKEQIENSFSNQGKQLKSLSMLIEERRCDELLTTINKTNKFKVSTSNKTEPHGLKCITIDIQKNQL
jgi:hypothetical protein